MPAGVPHDFYGRLAEAAQPRSRIIVDTSGPFLKAAVEAGVYLIKPNLREFQVLAGITTDDEAVLIGAGRRLLDRYRIAVIALSLGEDGALLFTHDVTLRAHALPIEPASVSGAGDSFLGAMIWSLVNGDPLERALRYAVAGGSAALLSPGTELCHADDVHRLASEVVVTTLAQGPH